jgi:hypothetical protein
VRSRSLDARRTVAIAYSGLRSDSVTSSVVVRVVARCRANTTGLDPETSWIGIEKECNIAWILNGGLDRSLEPLELIIKGCSAIRRGDRAQVLECGFDASCHLGRPGSGHADLVEGEMDVILPCHSAFD